MICHSHTSQSASVQYYRNEDYRLSLKSKRSNIVELITQNFPNRDLFNPTGVMILFRFILQKDRVTSDDTVFL